MSDAEHLIENAISALAERRDLDKELDAYYNKEMLNNVGISKQDLKSMASHVYYVLYEQVNPFK